MGPALTAVFLGVAAGLALVFGWLGARPPNPLKGPRLIPYRALMLACAALALLLAIHAVGFLKKDG